MNRRDLIFLTLFIFTISLAAAKTASTGEVTKLQDGEEFDLEGLGSLELEIWEDGETVVIGGEHVVENSMNDLKVGGSTLYAINCKIEDDNTWLYFLSEEPDNLKPKCGENWDEGNVNNIKPLEGIDKNPGYEEKFRFEKGDAFRLVRGSDDRFLDSEIAIYESQGVNNGKLELREYHIGGDMNDPYIEDSGYEWLRKIKQDSDYCNKETPYDPDKKYDMVDCSTAEVPVYTYLDTKIWRHKIFFSNEKKGTVAVTKREEGKIYEEEAEHAAELTENGENEFYLSGGQKFGPLDNILGASDFFQNLDAEKLKGRPFSYEEGEDYRLKLRTDGGTYRARIENIQSNTGRGIVTARINGKTYNLKHGVELENGLLIGADPEFKNLLVAKPRDYQRTFIKLKSQYNRDEGDLLEAGNIQFITDKGKYSARWPKPWKDPAPRPDYVKVEDKKISYCSYNPEPIEYVELENHYVLRTKYDNCDSPVMGDIGLKLVPKKVWDIKETGHGKFVTTDINEKSAELYDPDRDSIIKISEGEKKKIEENSNNEIYLKLADTGENSVSLEIEKKAKPDASISFKNKIQVREPSPNEFYYRNTKAKVKYSLKLDGKYRLKVYRDGEKAVDRKITEGGNVKVDTKNTGKLKAEIVAPSGFWDFFSSNKKLASNSINVKKFEVDKTLEWGESTTVKREDIVDLNGGGRNDRILEADGAYRSTRSSPEAAGIGFEHARTGNYFRNIGIGDTIQNIRVCSANRDRGDNGKIGKIAYGKRGELDEVCSQEEESDEETTDYSLEEKIEVKPGEKLAFGEGNNLKVEQIGQMYPGKEKKVISGSSGLGEHIEATRKENGYTDFREDGFFLYACSFNEESAVIALSDEEKERETICETGFKCEDYETGENEFKICSADRKKEVRIGDQKYSAELWFVSTSGNQPPTAEIDFKDTEDFKQIRSREAPQINDQPATKNNHKLYLYKHSGAGTQSPDDDAAVIRYEKVSEQNPGKKKSDTEIKVKTPEPETGKEVKLQLSTTEKLAEKSYQIKIKGPEKHTEKFEKQQKTHTFTPDEPGDYTVEIYPESNIPGIGGIVNMLTEPVEQETFTVTEKGQAAWRDYCQEKDYTPEEVEQSINCLKNEVVPKCFKEKPAEDCTRDGENKVAKSVCQNLLDYSYNPETQKCTP